MGHIIIIIFPDTDGSSAELDGASLCDDGNGDPISSDRNIVALFVGEKANGGI
jgi:hypothetical protein